MTKRLKNKDIKDFLLDSLSSEDSTILTDGVVDILLSGPKHKPSPAESHEFIEKRLKELYSEPVYRIKGFKTFGGWLESVRKGAKVSRIRVASALDKDEAFVEQLETSAEPPWATPAGDFARVMVLFKVHIRAVEGLINRVYSKPVRRTITIRGSSSELPLGFARPDDELSEREIPRDAEIWLMQLRDKLSELGANDLL